MAKAKTPKKKTLKKSAKVKKRWYSLQAPELFNRAQIGETLVAEPDLLIGREVRVNLMSLTRNVKQQNINVKFSITKITDKVAQTKIISYAMSPASIKRFVRRKISRIDDSFSVVTADNKTIRIKPLIITRSKVQRSVATDLRKVMREFLITEIAKKNYLDFVREVIQYKLQRSLTERLNKIYPVRIMNIRTWYVETEGKKQETKKTEAEHKETKETEKTEEPKEAEKPEPEAEKPVEPKPEEKAEAVPKKAVKKDEKPEDKPAEEKPEKQEEPKAAETKEAPKPETKPKDQAKEKPKEPKEVKKDAKADN